jgi:putative SOS response-associated peptidase YedK
MGGLPRIERDRSILTRLRWGLIPYGARRPRAENWKEPATGEWIIHDRMPVILAPGDYARWVSDEPDPCDLMRPFAADLMRMWPISARVNKPENDDPSIVEPIELAPDAA